MLWVEEWLVVKKQEMMFSNRIIEIFIYVVGVLSYSEESGDAVDVRWMVN